MILTEPAQSLDVPQATDARHGNWWPVAAMAVGIAFVLVAILPATLSDATNPYAAAAVILLGFVCIGVAVALSAYDAALTRMPRSISAAIALAAAVPVLLPIFLPLGADLGGPMLYVLAVGIASFAIRRTAASGVFLLLTAFGPAVYLVQQLFRGASI